MVASSNEIFTPCHIQIFILLCSESKRPVVNVNVAAKIAIFSSFQRKFIVKEAAVFHKNYAKLFSKNTWSNMTKYQTFTKVERYLEINWNNSGMERVGWLGKVCDKLVTKSLLIHPAHFPCSHCENRLNVCQVEYR